MRMLRRCRAQRRKARTQNTSARHSLGPRASRQLSPRSRPVQKSAARAGSPWRPGSKSTPASTSSQLNSPTTASDGPRLSHIRGSGCSVEQVHGNPRGGARGEDPAQDVQPRVLQRAQPIREHDLASREMHQERPGSSFFQVHLPAGHPPALRSQGRHRRVLAEGSEDSLAVLGGTAHAVLIGEYSTNTF